jgi:hypothetical protein
LQSSLSPAQVNAAPSERLSMVTLAAHRHFVWAVNAAAIV